MIKKLIYASVVILLSFCQAFAQNISIKHGPYLQNLEENEVTIVWVASKPSIGWVELALDGEDDFYSEERERFYDSSNGLNNISLVHSVRITNLTPGTKYRYRIFSKEVLEHKWVHVKYGRVASTVIFKVAPLKFTTLDRNKPTVSFAHLSDIHERAYDIPKLLHIAGLKDLDLVIYNGDMSSSTENEETLFRGFMDTTVVTFAKEKPMYYARGNHETRSVYASHFHEYFSPKKPNLYYTFRQGPAFFVVLDSGEDKPDSDIEYSELADFDRYRLEEAQWLRKVLESEEYQKAPYKIIVSHIPPIVSNENWHGENFLLKHFVPLLNKYKPDIVLSGHKHIYSYHDANSTVQFPVVVNAMDTVLKVEVDGNSLQMVVYNTKGRVIDKKTIYPQK